jgi:hypothetical protein
LAKSRSDHIYNHSKNLQYTFYSLYFDNCKINKKTVFYSILLLIKVKFVATSIVEIETILTLYIESVEKQSGTGDCVFSQLRTEMTNLTIM